MLQYESGTELPKVFQRACDLREIFSMQQRFAPCDKSMPLKTRGSTRSSHFKLNARKSWPHLVVITLKSWRPTTSGQFTCSNLWINFIYFIRLSTVSGSWTRALLYSLSPYLKVSRCPHLSSNKSSKMKQDTWRGLQLPGQHASLQGFSSPQGPQIHGLVC